MEEESQRSPSPKRKKNMDVGSSYSAPTPRYLVMKKVTGDFSKDNPFFIAKTLKGMIQFKNVKKIRDGLLIETEKVIDSQKLLKVVNFGSFPVVVVPHSSLNYSKGVVSWKDLIDCPVELIKSELSSQNVVDVKRITVRRDEIIRNTASLILTFNTSNLPSTILAGYRVLRVRPYIPAPLRCFKCQKFGHVASRCDKEQVCVCGKSLHEGSPCVQPLSCVNCSGDHSSRSKLCAVYQNEAAIQELKTREKISYFEARRKLAPQNLPRPNVSYSQAVTSAPVTVTREINIEQLVEKLLPALLTALAKSLPILEKPQEIKKPVISSPKPKVISAPVKCNLQSPVCTETIDNDISMSVSQYESSSESENNDMFTKKSQSKSQRKKSRSKQKRF